MLAFLSDFGLADTYAAQMELVARDMLGAQACIVHLTHGVPPFCLSSGAWHLGAAAALLGPEAVVVAVVDPGVGTNRPLVWARLLSGAQVLATHPHLLAFCPLAQGPLAIPPVFIPPSASNTFHGRDVLTPLACRLLNQRTGKADENLDPTRWEKLPFKKPAFAQVRRRGATLATQVVQVDRFGNLITPLAPTQFEGKTPVSLSVGQRAVYNQQDTFAQGKPGEVFWYWGSQGTLEIAIFQQSAAQRLGLGVGAAVRVVLGD